jgi:hypothetical protein
VAAVRRKPPVAFTEHGAIMAATPMSLYAVRTYVKLREVLASNDELARKLESLERSVAALDANTRRQFQEVCGAILALVGPMTIGHDKV